jgi:hypothetical protein
VNPGNIVSISFVGKNTASSAKNFSGGLSSTASVVLLVEKLKQKFALGWS